MANFEVDRKAGEIRELPDLLQGVAEARQKSPTGAVWLRGLNKEEYDLKPSIGREHKYAGESFTFDTQTEKHLLHRFRRYAFEYLGRILNEWEALFLARHHGLPVRIMDWTSSPLAALYFACRYSGQEEPKTGRIWMLIPKQGRAFFDVLSDDKGPFQLDGIKQVYPIVVAPRINAQSGFFTIQQNPWRSLDRFDVVEYPDEQLDIDRLVEYTVPAGEKNQLLLELNRVGVNRRTLFPDLDGLGAGLLHDQIMRKQ